MSIGRRGGEDRQSCFPSLASRPDPRLPEAWRQPAPFSGRAGSPAVPGLAGVGAAASMTSARSGPACPVHLDKLRLTGEQSLWSRRPPVAPPSRPNYPAQGWAKWLGWGGGPRGEWEARLLPSWVVAPTLLGDRGQNHFFRLGPRKCLGRTACVALSPVFPANRKARLAALLRDSPGPQVSLGTRS